MKTGMAPSASDMRDIAWARRIRALAERFPNLLPAWIQNAARGVLPLESYFVTEIENHIRRFRPHCTRLVAGYADGESSARITTDGRQVAETHPGHMLDLLRTVAVFLESGRALPGTEPTDRVRLVRTPDATALVIDFTRSAHERMARLRPCTPGDRLQDIA